MNVFKAVILKLISALLFALMSALVRYVGNDVPLGQTVFFRAAFAVVPVIILLAWRRELGSALYTARPLGHVGRGSISVCGMFLNFAALQRLPLSDATAISFASPLITVAFAAIFLGEHVRIYRWTAVGVGFIGIVVMLWPYLDVGHFTAPCVRLQAEPRLRRYTGRRDARGDTASSWSTIDAFGSGDAVALMGISEATHHLIWSDDDGLPGPGVSDEVTRVREAPEVVLLEEHQRVTCLFHGMRASSMPMPQVSVMPAKIRPHPTKAVSPRPHG